MLVLFRIQRIKRSALLTICISVVEVTASFTLFLLSFCALRLVESCWIPTLLSMSVFLLSPALNLVFTKLFDLIDDVGC